MSKRYKDVKKFVVKRSKWFRGRGNTLSRLQTDNQMCCLGFYAKECGLKKKNITDVVSPGEIEYEIKDIWDTFLLARISNIYDSDPDDPGLTDIIIDSEIANSLMEINDDVNISDEDREYKLKELFKEQGIKVKFVD